MEEVDKIIIQSLSSLGCEIGSEIKSLGQLEQEVLIEAIAKLLNSLNPNQEPLPTKLPPNTAVKYRICTKFANLCQELGYKNEIGYQTFLYSNENDIRRLLIFLVEKLTKDTSTSESSASNTNQPKKTLKTLLAEELKRSTRLLWIPSYLKIRGLRRLEDNSYAHEGCKYLVGSRQLPLTVPKNYLNAKAKYSIEAQEYFEKHCLHVTHQVKRQAVDVLTSLMQQNTNEILKEQVLLKQGMHSSTEELKKAKSETLNELKNALKVTIQKYDDMFNESNSSSTLSKSDLAEIDLGLSPKSLFAKGSRFTHSEKLQFSKDDAEQNVSIVSSSSQNDGKEEIKNLKEKLDNLNESYSNLEQKMKRMNTLISKLEEDCLKQDEFNKQMQEKILIKRKTVNLINDAPMNIIRLKEEINNHQKKMENLEAQWEAHKKPLEEEKEQINQQIAEKKQQLQEKIEETKHIKQQIDELNGDLSLKEGQIKNLNKELENQQKQSSKTSNRQFYTKRILEIVGNIDKQKKEIDKVLIETKSIQKEINQLTGKLERIFNSTDELIFKDAKKDELNKKVYKAFININKSYEELIKTIEDSGHIDRETKDLEDQISAESQNKTEEKIEMLLQDFKQVKAENEQLMSKLKASK